MTVLVVLVFVAVEPVKEFVQDNPAIVWTAWAVSVVTLIALLCCDEVRRDYPNNLIALGVFVSSLLARPTRRPSDPPPGLRTDLVRVVLARCAEQLL